MKKIVCLTLLAALLLFGTWLWAQVARPYHDGSVWTVAQIRIKPGMEPAYLNYLTTDWKREQEEMKKAGLTLSYKVLMGEAHGSNDWNMLLLTEYKNLAAMEANEQKMDAMAQQMFGGDEKIQEGYRRRLEIREVLGDRMMREIILEPRK